MPSPPPRERLEEALHRELDPGEEYVWIGFPDESLFLERAKGIITFSFAAALFITFFTGFVQMLEANTSYMEELNRNPDSSLTYWDFTPQGIEWLYTFWAFPVALFSFLSIRHYKRLARELAYAITQSRAIVLRLHKSGELTERDYNPDELIHLARRENADGTGDVMFQNARGTSASSSTNTRHGFFAVPNVLEAERILRKQFGDTKPNP